MISRRILALLLLIALAACTRAPGATTDPGVDFADPDVGGGAGEDSGPQTPVPTATPTREASPRLDATAAATVIFPQATPTPTTDDRPQTTVEATAAITMPATVPASPTPEAATPEVATPAATPAATPVAPTPATATPNPNGERIHVVQAGENLYRIGLQYGLSWTVIAEYNGITDPNAITAGQELRIPPAPTATATAEQEGSGAGEQGGGGEGESGAASGGVSPAPPLPRPPASSPPVISVAPGDTLYAIAQRHGVSWELIAEANGLGTPNQIYAGQVLKIPADAPGPTPEFAHQVHRGETLSDLARQYGLPAEALATANGLTAPYTIYPGQTLLIPTNE